MSGIIDIDGDGVEDTRTNPDITGVQIFKRHGLDTRFVGSGIKRHAIDATGYGCHILVHSGADRPRLIAIEDAIGNDIVMIARAADPNPVDRTRLKTGISQ